MDRDRQMRGGRRGASDRATKVKNLDDTDVDAEIARNLWKHRRMLPPNSSFKHYWDLVLLFFVVYYTIIVPLQLAFTLQAEEERKLQAIDVVEILIDCLFFVDIGINFRSSFYDEDGQIVLDEKAVARRYLQTWFVIDLIASLPYNIITMLGNDLGFLSVLKLIRLTRMTRLWKKVEQLSSAQLLRVFFQVTAFLVVAHWVGCFWWMIGTSTYEKENVDGRSWLVRVPLGSTLLHKQRGSALDQTSLAQQYWSSFYWSLTTLMKTPWVGPDTVLEKVYSCICVVLGAGIFAILLGNVTAMVASYDKTSAELRDKMTTLHNFATFKRVPASLQRKMYAYIGAYWRMTAGLDQNAIMTMLPTRLRGDLVLAIHGSLVDDCPILKTCSTECAKTMLLRLKPQVCLQKEALLVPGQLCSEVYILLSGSLQTTLPMHGVSERDSGGTYLDPQRSSGASDASRQTSASKGVGNLATPSFMSRKGALRFRMIEKPGQVVGIAEPLQRKPTPYPFLVTAVKASELVYISKSDLVDVLGVFEGQDAKHISDVLQGEFKMCWETLKPRNASSSSDALEHSGPPIADTAAQQATLLEQQSQEISSLRSKLGDFESRLDSCIMTLQQTQQQTALLPQMQEVLLAIVKAHEAGAGTSKVSC